MTAMLANVFGRLIQNKHTSGAAAVYLASEAAAQIGKIWWPAHAQQIDDSVKALQKLAVGYGLVMAGDSQPTGNTQFFRNPNPQPAPPAAP